MTEAIKVSIGNSLVGYMTWDSAKKKALFEYDKSFVDAGIDIAPLCMPLNSIRSQKGMSWPGNEDKLYRGLPPTFADSLPDKWGSTLFNKWVEQNNIKSKSITPLDHLAFIGKRTMGALEYEPAIQISGEEPTDINVQELYVFSQKIINKRESTFLAESESILWQDLIKISTSAGGKRPKAIVAINEKTGLVMSGQGVIPDGFTHYILKYDDGKGFPYAKMEYAYYLIAQEAGIKMMPSLLRKFGDVSHFLTERYDRDGNVKIHTQTLAAMEPSADCYEDIFAVMRKLNLPYEDFRQMFKIMVFNILGGNIDDHNKNFSFYMEPNGKWHLAPAYDLTFCIDPNAPKYLNQHELSIKGKKNSITKDDLIDIGKKQDITNCNHLYEEVESSFELFPTIAKEVGIDNIITQYVLSTDSILNRYK